MIIIVLNVISLNTRLTRHWHGHLLAHTVGSIEKGKLADIVLAGSRFLWRQTGTYHKGGMKSLMRQWGDINAAIPTPQPVHYRPMYACLGKQNIKRR